MVRLRDCAAQSRQVPKRSERDRCPHSRRDCNGSLWGTMRCLCAKDSAAFCSGNVSHLPRPETESAHDNETSWRQRSIRRTSFPRSDLRCESRTARILGERLNERLSCWSILFLKQDAASGPRKESHCGLVIVALKRKNNCPKISCLKLVSRNGV